MKATKTWVLIVLLFIPAINVHAWPWPDTGQTKCYDYTDEIACPAPGQPFYGQDGQYQGPTRSYTKLGQNGVVLPNAATYADGWLMTRDNVTGLVWEMKTVDGTIHDKDKGFTWCDKNPATNGGDEGTCGTETGNAATDTAAFIKALNDANLGGFSNWRMPTIKELSSLVNSDIHPNLEPRIDTAWFPNTVASNYWSSTNTSQSMDSAWIVRFLEGYVITEAKMYPRYMRAVRGGSTDRDSLVDNGDGTVTDTNTGLMWQKVTDTWIFSWENALAYAEALDLAGHTDWRLPNRNELQSLLDYSRMNPAIDPLLAPYTMGTNYWSSTTRASNTGSYAWHVSFYLGHIYSSLKGGSHYTYVRAVRGGYFGSLGDLMISGTVRDAVTGQPISGVFVRLNTGASATTNGSGAFSFSRLSSGSYGITAQTTGYAAGGKTVTLTNANASVSIRLTRSEAAYGGRTTSGYSPDPVNTATGNYIYNRKDLEIPGKSIPFALVRYYNSQSGTDGPLGFGWGHSYHVRLTENGDATVSIRWGDGKTETWTPDGQGGFTAQTGVYDRLVKDGGTFTLTKRNRDRYAFDATGRLLSVTDRNGSAIALAFTGGNLSAITDTGGRIIALAYDGNNRLTTITDPLTRTVSFTYDGVGNLVTATDPNGNVTAYTYDADHQLLTVVDPRGNTVVTNTYDAQKRVVTSQRDAKGGQTLYTYQEAEGKTTLTDALGGTTIHYHDELLRLIKETDPLGNSAEYAYDATGNRTQVKDKRGNIIAYTYDARGNVLTKTDALNGTTTITYDAQDNPLTRTDPLGAITGYAYDANGNVTQSTDPLGKVTAFTYNAFGQPITVTDPLGHVTANAYDAEGNLITVKDPLNQETHHSYDAVGRRLSRTDPLNHATTYAYDANNNLLTVTAPGGGISTYTYDGNNNRLNAQDPMGNITRYAYDAKDLLTTTTDPLNRTVTVTYDALDRKIQERDRKNQQTTFTYDGAGRLLTVTNPLGQITTYTYDADGNRLTETNPLGKTTTFAYDAINRLISTTDPLGNITTFAYDAAGRMTAKTNAKGQITRNDYDLMGRLLKVTDPAGGTAEYAYDATGRRLSMKDTRGNMTTYAYDAAGRLTGKTEPLATAHQYDYDFAGRMIRYVSPKAEIITYTYDADDRLTGIAYPGGATVSYSYNANGLKTGMTDSLGSTTFTYDALNRLASSTDPFGQTVQHAYDENGNRTSITYPGNKTVTYVYDVANRLSTVQDWLNKTTAYAYDAAGRLTGVTIPNGTAAIYAYDNADRLTTLTHAKQETTLFLSTYTLDAIGNPLNETRTEPVSAVYKNSNAAYLYDAENRLTSGGSHAYTYDPKGNLTVDQRPDAGLNTYAYDPENRLTQSVISGITTQYGYDGTSARLTKSVSGTATRYILDPGGSLPQILAETDGSGVITAYYVYGHGLISRIASDGTARYYHHDSRGSTIALTDANGNITDAYAYNPFGTLRKAQGSTVQPFKYIGRHGVMDEGNGLSYIRARYYMPEMGRFLTKDPLTGNDGDTQSLNRYVYALNNPIRLIDISGLSAKEGKVLGVYTTSSDTNHQNYLDYTEEFYSVESGIKYTLEHSKNPKDPIVLRINYPKKTQTLSDIKNSGSYSDFAKQFIRTSAGALAAEAIGYKLIQLGATRLGLAMMSPIGIILVQTAAGIVTAVEVEQEHICGNLMMRGGACSELDKYRQ